MKLLIAENNEEMRRLIVGIVSDLAGAVIECADGSEAVIAYQIHHPDFVLMNAGTAGFDGIEATRRIVDADPSARVMIVSDADDPRLRSEASGAGALGYVLKDDLAVLRDVLRFPER